MAQVEELNLISMINLRTYGTHPFSFAATLEGQVRELRCVLRIWNSSYNINWILEEKYASGIMRTRLSRLGKEKSSQRIFIIGQNSFLAKEKNRFPHMR